MTLLPRGLCVSLLVSLGTIAATGATDEPLWAYMAVKPPGATDRRQPWTLVPMSSALRPNEPAERQTRPRHVPGSTATFTLRQRRDGGNVIDWFPEDHPPMPAIIEHGSKALGTSAIGCAWCHTPDGAGRPENAPLAGQPAAYLLRQLQDFRNGARNSADPRKRNTEMMIALAKGMSDDDMNTAAAYFSTLKFRPLTRVVETETVPQTTMNGNVFVVKPGGETEPIAGRIVEVPEDAALLEGTGNPRARFIAYVPVGSLARGRDFIERGGPQIGNGPPMTAQTIACVTCHGPDLMGVADIPGIAGRSPSYLARQLYDFQRGTRHGTLASVMQPVVANLTTDDITAIAAYVSSLVPPPTDHTGPATAEMTGAK